MQIPGKKLQIDVKEVRYHCLKGAVKRDGKVERSHRNNQRYFYNWEKFASVEELNEKLREHLCWSNRKTMRTLDRKSPLTLLKEKKASNLDIPYLVVSSFFFFYAKWVTSIDNAEKK